MPVASSSGGIAAFPIRTTLLIVPPRPSGLRGLPVGPEEPADRPVLPLHLFDDHVHALRRVPGDAGHRVGDFLDELPLLLERPPVVHRDADDWHAGLLWCSGFVGRGLRPPAPLGRRAGAHSAARGPGRPTTRARPPAAARAGPEDAAAAPAGAPARPAAGAAPFCRSPGAAPAASAPAV